MTAIWNASAVTPLATDRIARTTRNTVQQLPGGSQAFPTEANGTVNWIGNPLRGDNVLGAAFRGASGINTAQTIGSGIRNAFVGNRSLDPNQFAGSAERISRAASRPGSVVARGFVSRAQLGPTAGSGVGRARNVEPRNALGYRVGDAPGVPAGDSGYQMPGTEGSASAGPAPQGASGGAQRGGGLLGAGQRFGSQLSFADHYDAIARRGGTQEER